MAKRPNLPLAQQACNRPDAALSALRCVKKLRLPLLIASLMGTSQLAQAHLPAEAVQPHSNNLSTHLSVITRHHSLAKLITDETASHVSDPVAATKYKLNHYKVAKGNKASKSAAASAAKKRYGGKVLKVSQAGEDFRVKLLLDNGRIKIVSVDGATGKVR